MGQINTGRVILGGLLAGLIINLAELLSASLFRDTYERMFEALGLPPMGGGSIATLVIGGFVVGVVIAWVYAGFRPRFGAGPLTAMYAGLVVWLLGWLWQMVVDVATGFYDLSLGMWVVSIAWTLVEVELAALAAGWLYREG